MLAVLEVLGYVLAGTVVAGAFVYGYDRLNAWIVTTEQEEVAS